MVEVLSFQAGSLAVLAAGLAIGLRRPGAIILAARNAAKEGRPAAPTTIRKRRGQGPGRVMKKPLAWRRDPDMWWLRLCPNHHIS
jgi:hypothetical protein